MLWRRKREERRFREICEKLLAAKSIEEQAEILSGVFRTQAAKSILSREAVKALTNTREFEECAERTRREIHERFPLVFCLFYVVMRLDFARLKLLMENKVLRVSPKDVVKQAKDSKTYTKMFDTCLEMVKQQG